MSGTQGRVVFTEAVNSCFINIVAPQNYSLSIFSYEMYFMEQNCEKDSIEVLNYYTNATIQKICNGASPLAVFTNQSALLVKINMNTYYSQYDLTYIASKVGPGCGGDLYNTEGIFTSPYFPNHVRENSDCRWNIRVPMNVHIFLRFERK